MIDELHSRNEQVFYGLSLKHILSSFTVGTMYHSKEHVITEANFLAFLIFRFFVKW